MNTNPPEDSKKPEAPNVAWLVFRNFVDAHAAETDRIICAHEPKKIESLWPADIGSPVHCIRYCREQELKARIWANRCRRENNGAAQQFADDAAMWKRRRLLFEADLAELESR